MKIVLFAIRFSFFVFFLVLFFIWFWFLSLLTFYVWFFAFGFLLWNILQFLCILHVMAVLCVLLHSLCLPRRPDCLSACLSLRLSFCLTRVEVSKCLNSAAWRIVYTFHINNNIYSVQLLLQLQLSWVHLIYLNFYTFSFCFLFVFVFVFRTYAKIIVDKKNYTFCICFFFCFCFCIFIYFCFSSFYDETTTKTHATYYTFSYICVQFFFVFFFVIC